jgi:long-chain acyl-CoA synthetase
MLVHHLLQAAADRLPEKPAVCHKGRWSTYAEIEASSRCVAQYFRSAGVQPGDRIALLMENSTEYIVAHMAVFKAGAVNVSLNTETTPEALRYLLNDCEAKVLVIGQKYLRHLNEIKDKPEHLEHVVVDGAADSVALKDIDAISLAAVSACESSNRLPDLCSDSDLASIVYTSGSTGKPKGVMLSHRNLISSCDSTVSYLGLREDDRMMVVLPFHYIYGTSLLYTHFAVGGSLVIENGFVFPNVVLNSMDQHQVTGFAGVPSTFMLLLNKSTLRTRRFDSLRYVTQAGGALAPNLQKELHQAFAPAKLFIMYGATEAAPRLTYVNPEDLPTKWGSIGKAVPNVEVFPADTSGVRVARGMTGEIVARGPNIMMGYWKDVEGTAEVLRDGLYFTGDLGREDEDGFLFLEGRIKDIIKVGGNRVGAKEIEEKILELDGVAEVAVIGVSDPILGEAIKAFVVPKDDIALTPADVKTHLERNLPLYKQPKWITMVSNLPKNAAGKIAKAQLRAEDVQRPMGGD